MKRARVAFYGFTDENRGFVDAVKGLTKHFRVRCFKKVETDTFLNNDLMNGGVVTRIHRFDPHILVFRYPGNGLDLYALLKERVYFLPVVLTVYADDRNSLEILKKAGIAEWQVANRALTYESFSKHIMLGLKKEHLDK